MDDSEQLRRNISFHSCRHSFITLGRQAGIPDLEIQALAGHKSGAIMERYSHAAPSAGLCRGTGENLQGNRGKHHKYLNCLHCLGCLLSITSDSFTPCRSVRGLLCRQRRHRE
ncbi:MAG: tyrosine-type recombinase/integrase [Spirochaetaceae bacterium]|nr:tyrosine-type recombinase/integrase [Spirochaetaceae bacterium]